MNLLDYVLYFLKKKKNVFLISGSTISFKEVAFSNNKKLIETN